ncbi:hypothetical protein LUZ60_010058 [Juncus effusus]|nr:hypothetical protein LUZ60_010058 [Juncus effusus]
MAMSSSSSSSPNSHKSTSFSLSSFTSTLLSRLPFNSKSVQSPPPVTVPFFLPASNFNTANPNQARSVVPGLRIEGLSSKGGGVGGGPVFVGQVFTMLDPSGNGLMAVTRHFHLPFLAERTPEWLKKMLATVTKSDTNGPVFRFFMDLTDAVSYVKKLNVPAGMVGACRLDIAYEHFREKPHLFQFVPNEKQVKAANKLLKSINQSQKSRRRKVNGVPVFAAQNLNIAMATNDGIRWYRPYFFDKSMLDKILEASVDQHFDTMIHMRHALRRGDFTDDSFSSEIVEEFAESLFEPPEVQELMDEMGQSGIPLSVLSKAAEIEICDFADKILLGNKWVRKALLLQPKFPYLVDSFEERSAASFNKAATSTSGISNYSQNDVQTNTKEDDSRLVKNNDIQFPFGNWIPNIWPGQHVSTRLPNVTMFGIAVEGNSQMNKANLKKTMDDLTKELEQSNYKHNDQLNEEKDPLFLANFGDYSRFTRFNSS